MTGFERPSHTHKSYHNSSLVSSTVTEYLVPDLIF